MDFVWIVWGIGEIPPVHPLDNPGEVSHEPLYWLRKLPHP